jgi:ER membrane protein complex subunit 6
MATADEAAAQLIYGPNILHNTSISTTKFLSSCFAGAAAGILGLEDWRGFVLFGASTLFTATLLSTISCKGQPKKYVRGGWVELANPDVFSFILVWTLFCGLNFVAWVPCC